MTWRKAIFILATLMFAEVAFGQVCPLQGTAKGAPIKAANRLKNRTAIPDVTDYDSAFTIDAVLNPGDDNNPTRWDQNYAGMLDAYVFNVKPGGIETVNCGAKAISARDTHIELVRSLDDTAKSRRVIVEITPRMRLLMKHRGIDWSTPTLIRTLKGKHVEIDGWIFNDFEHSGNAENTHPRNRLNWRATTWELHPVISITILK